MVTRLGEKRLAWILRLASLEKQKFSDDSLFSFYGKMKKKSKRKQQKGSRKRNYRTTPEYLPGRFDPDEMEIKFDNDTVTAYGGGNLIKKFLKRFDLRKE